MRFVGQPNLGLPSSRRVPGPGTTRITNLEITGPVYISTVQHRWDDHCSSLVN